MDLLAAWLLFPLVLAVVSLGLGLLIERAAGLRLQGTLLLPLGFAGVLVVSRAMTASATTAPLTLPLLLGLAVAGIALGLSRLRGRRLDWAAAAAAVGVVLVSGAPVILSGEPTFGGSLLLPDTAHQLALASFLPEHGRDWESLEQSAYALSVRNYIVTAYPVASQAALGALAPLGLLEVAWLYQPYLSFLLALLALGIFGLLRNVVTRPRDRAFVALIAAQPALVVSYALQGSIKEITAMPLVVLAAALAAESIRGSWRARAFLTLAVVVAGAFGALGPAAAVYVAPLVAVASGLWLVRTVRAPSAREALIAVGVIAVAVALMLPLLGSIQTAYDVNSATLEAPDDLGNLPGPLSIGQVTGIWLNGDYRYLSGTARIPTVLLQIAAGLAALAGLLWAVRRRALGPLVLLVPICLTSAYLLQRGNSYADAKVLCFLAPAVVMSALLPAAFLHDRGRRLAGLVVAAVVGGGVLLSNATTYLEVQLAPYERYSELLDIGDRIGDSGPTLVTEYDEYSKYLLHEAVPYAQPEWPHGYRGASLADPARRPSIKTPMDLDDLTIDYVQSVPVIVVRRSPTATRPPANYTRTFAGRYYEVWRPDPDARWRVAGHLALGADVSQPGGPAPCGPVRRLARRASALGGRLAYVSRPRLFSIRPASIEHRPFRWFGYGAYPGAVVPVGSADFGREAAIPPGRMRVWLEGSFGRPIGIRVNGRTIGSVGYEPGNPGQYLPVGYTRIPEGTSSRVDFVRGGGNLRPGNGGGGDSSLRHVGPLVFSPPANELRHVRTLAPGRAGSLCGHWVDWVEVVVPARAGRIE